MPQKVKLEDGTEQEVFTAEEVEARSKESVQKAEKELAEKHEAEKQEFETKAQEQEQALTEAQDKIKKFESKDYNFEELRKKAEKRTSEEEKVFKEMDDLKKTVDSIQRQPLVAAKTEFVKNNIGTDKTLSEKFEHFYEVYGKSAKTMEEVNAALVAAYAAATDGKSVPNNNSRMIATGVNDNFAGFDDTTKETEASQEFGAMLGLTPDDKKKYGNLAKSGSVPLTANTHPMFSKKE